jgi:formylglycine-generating enzyme
VTPYWFGDDERHLCLHGNVADEQVATYLLSWPMAPCNDGFQFSAPGAQFKRNAFGLYDVHGNAYEWTADCWRKDYEGAPADGSATEQGDCRRRVMRGGSWVSSPINVRAAYRTPVDAARRSHINGFRVARTIMR